MYMKKYFIYSAALLALVSSCQSDDFLGNNGGNVQTSGNETAINFAGGTGKITRAVKKEGEAAGLLHNHFVVFGDKTTGSTTQKVYDHYDVKWIGKADADKTQSNQEGWEYVGLTPNKNSNLPTGAEQTIKYWDYSASEYSFAAFSMGDLTPETGDTYDNQVDKDAATIESGKVKISQLASNATKYTIEGSAEDIAKLYISDRVTAKQSGAKSPDINYMNAVQFNFRALKSQVRMGIFEIVPGYSVKDVKFYSSETDTQAKEAPSLYATTTSIPAGKGKAIITFGAKDATDGSYNKAMVEWQANDNVSVIQFEALSKKKEELKEEAGDKYIGRTANDASLPTKYTTVIPSANIGALTLKVDYTLVSTDGSNEEIKVTGATATVPSEYTQWQPNYSYTYIFKISDKTNGTTGKPGDTNPAGLYPIVFDAVVTETSEGIQNTITTVEDASSITTYAKGNKIGTEYKINDNIYACVIDKASGKTIDLYTKATNTEGNDTFTYHAILYQLSGTTESITEAEAKAILDSNKTLGGKTLSKVGTYDINAKDDHFVSQIDATDAVDGVAVKGYFFKFKPTDAGTYVFAYVNGNTRSYKVIKVTAN